MEIKILNTLTPAEALILINGKEEILRKLLKVTLMHLLIRKVLKLTEVKNEPDDPSGHILIQTYIVCGEHYGRYLAMPHESIFLEPYRIDRTLQILFGDMVKIGYEGGKTTAHFKRILVRTEQIKPFFKKTLWHSLFNPVSLNVEGRLMKLKIENEIRYLESNLPLWLENEKSKAMDIVAAIGANVALLNGLDASFFQQIETQFDMNRPPEKKNDTSGCTNASCGSVYPWDIYSTSFDNSCHASTNNDAAWGCSADSSGGDSGCGGSGCSGCGGGGGGD